uniref:Uncharacterized protein n=1 Tax=viral metagenome TaxID=1070528 RepID=A0A6H1ZYN4_9ZZZZ
MAQKTVAIIVLMLLLGIGFLLGSFMGGFIGQLTVPARHKAIVDAMTIKTGTIKLEPVYLSTGNSKWQLSILTENFEKYGTYTYSIWVYSYQSDPEVYVCIWGPGKDGKTFQVELCSSWTRPFTAQYGTEAPIDFTGQTFFAVQVT